MALPWESKTFVTGALSIDRCTFLVFSPSLSLWDCEESEKEINKGRIQKMKEMVFRALGQNLDSDFPQGGPSELFLHHFRTTAGVDIQFGAFMPVRKKVTDAKMIEMFGSHEDKENGYMFRYSPNAYSFRVEYNPNDCDLASVKPLLQYFSSSGVGQSLVRIARLDLAFDYKAKIDPSLCLCQGMRKSFLACGASGLETVYFGSRASKNYVRIYNKAVEMLEKDNIDLGYDFWRVELESKDSFFLDDPPDHGKVLQRLNFYNGALGSDDWKFEFFRAYAKDYGMKAALAKMPNETARRFRKLLNEFDLNHNLEHPGIIYYRDFPLKMKILRMNILNALGHRITLEEMV